MDDSDKAGADFASKPNGAWAAAIGQTVYRDGFMPASLGINYTPCQAADARSSDQRWLQLRAAPIVTAVRDGSGKEKERQEKRCANGRGGEEKRKRGAFLWYTCLLTRSFLVIYTSAKSHRKTRCCVYAYKDACALSFRDHVQWFDGNATRRKRRVTQHVRNYMRLITRIPISTYNIVFKNVSEK